MSQGNNNNLLPLFISLIFTIALLALGGFWVMRLLNQQEVNPFEDLLAVREEDPPVGSEGNVATFAEVQGVPSGLFNYGGSTTWAPIRRDVDPLIQKAWPDFRLRYVDPPTGTPGSGSGIRMLLNNQLSFSQSSRPLNPPEQQQAQTQGVRLAAIPVAIDALAIAVNPNLSLKGLTVQQLVDIYTGKIRNWSQVGGPNVAITAFSRRPEDGGTVEFFIQEMLGGQSFGSNVVMVRDTTDALRRVAATAGGIYYGSAPEIVGQCSVYPLPLGRQANTFIPPYQPPYVELQRCPAQRNRLNHPAFQDGSYPITRRLFVIVKEDGSLDAQAGRAYANLLLTNQGQAAIEQTGYVRLR